jgi:hypothetical protein
VYEVSEAIVPPASPRITGVVTSDNDARVHFSSVAGARAYKVFHGASELTSSSEETINDFFDVRSLAAGQNHQFAVVALNERGSSALSDPVTARIAGAALPPVIWATQPVRGGFVVGYAVDEEDRSFTLHLTNMTTGERLRLEEVTLKGSIRVDGLGSGRYSYRLRRNGDYGVSSWSTAREVQVLEKP